MNRRCVPAFGATVCGVCLAAGSAHAFSAVESFRYPAGASGGANRYFTGSPVEGYTCKVCHRDEEGPDLDIRGLPLSSYQSNTRYEVLVDWRDALDSVAVSIEITDSEGRRAGELTLAPDDEIETPEYCAPAENEIPAAQLTLVPPDSELDNFGYCTRPAELPEDCRQIVSVPHCGAKRLRFAWKAPASDRGTLWFSGGAVLSNQDNDTTGDGVTDISRAIGTDAIASETTASCSAVLSPRESKPSGLHYWIAGLLLACCFWRRNRRMAGTRPSRDA